MIITKTQHNGILTIALDGRMDITTAPDLEREIKTEKNPDELERVYQIGVHEAEKRLEDIQSFLTGGDME
jgi:predicted patatin/cPLA2 family phospholipase